MKILTCCVMLFLTGCATPRATFDAGTLKASPGIVATYTIEGPKETYTIDTTAHNWWSRVQDVSGRMFDRIAGMVSKTSANVGD